jgi:hypothetical protein
MSFAKHMVPKLMAKFAIIWAFKELYDINQVVRME